MGESLDDVLTPVGGRLQVPDGWQQGRGAFGGLVLGAMTRALAGEVGGDRALRTLSATLMAPVVVGEAEIAVAILRAGSAVTTASAILLQDGAVAAQAVGIFGAPRPGTPAWTRLAPPRPTPWRDLPDVRLPSPPVPIFTRHFDMRVEAGFPFSGAAGGEVLGWVRPRAPATRRDAAYVVTLADCYFPVVLSEMTAPRPVATVSYHIELGAPLDGLDPDAPLLHHATAPFAAEGYVVDRRELWGEDGRLVALNQQTFVVIK
jgi:acyl-CoA thioesterase